MWIWSIGWELMELTFMYWLPNFSECWWDSLIFDLLGCNFFGMIVGSWFVSQNRMMKFHWFIEPDQAMEKMSFTEKCKYFVSARKSYQQSGKWHLFANPMNLGYV